MTIYKLGEIATVEISGVDKKIKDGERPVKLCNFVDVYYNWAITSDLEQKFMEATARTNEIERFKLKRGQVALTKDSETRFDSKHSINYRYYNCMIKLQRLSLYVGVDSRCNLLYLYAVVVLYLVTQFCHNCFRMQCLPFVWEQFYEFFVRFLGHVWHL